jgi:hypothetical protein
VAFSTSHLPIRVANRYLRVAAPFLPMIGLR